MSARANCRVHTSQRSEHSKQIRTKSQFSVQSQVVGRKNNNNWHLSHVTIAKMSEQTKKHHQSEIIVPLYLIFFLQEDSNICRDQNRFVPNKFD